MIRAPAQNYRLEIVKGSLSATLYRGRKVFTQRLGYDARSLLDGDFLHHGFDIFFDA